MDKNLESKLNDADKQAKKLNKDSKKLLRKQAELIVDLKKYNEEHTEI